MQPQPPKSYKIQLVVTRHGQTQQNHKKVICGQNPGKLTQQGKLQAQLIGSYISTSSQNFNKIYVSDLGRTRQTFENIKLKAAFLSKIQSKFDSLLREKCGGVLTGQSLSAWQRQAKKQNKNIREYKCKDGESWIDVNHRVRKFIQSCIKENIIDKENVQKEQKILVVCHGGYIMEFHNVVREISSKGKEKAVFTNSAKNCSIHVFQLEYKISNKDKQIKKYNQDNLTIKCTVNNFTEHLEKK